MSEESQKLLDYVDAAEDSAPREAAITPTDPDIAESSLKLKTLSSNLLDKSGVNSLQGSVNALGNGSAGPNGPNGLDGLDGAGSGGTQTSNFTTKLPALEKQSKGNLVPSNGIQHPAAPVVPPISHTQHKDGKPGHETVDMQSQPIVLKTAAHFESHGPEDIIDADLVDYIQTDPMLGLTDEQVQQRLEKFGPNGTFANIELAEEKVSALRKFLGYFGGPISILLEVATILSAITGDWPDFVILGIVLIVNACIGYFEESKAESALDALKNTLCLKCRVHRNGKMAEIRSTELVPGDVIALRLGDIVPADCKLLGLGVGGEVSAEGVLQIDQSALTGESIAVKKMTGSVAYSSSIVKQGQMLCVVTKTGSNTYIGRAATLISSTNDEGHFQKIINAIGNFLIVISVVMVVILLVVLSCTLDEHGNRPDFMVVLKKIIVLTVAAIPLGLPTVMSVTMAAGAQQLTRKQVVVKRLAAIEELASVSILCSDKTGTLTLNQLTLDKPYLANVGSKGDNMDGDKCGTYSIQKLLRTAYLACEPGTEEPIERAVRTAAECTLPELLNREDHRSGLPGYKVISFIPFNPHSKYTEAVVVDLKTNTTFRCFKGAPQVISKMCGGHASGDEAVVKFSSSGLRALGVARTVDEDMKDIRLVGMLSLIDPPRVDSADTVRQCKSYGVQVKMITGDQLVIAKLVAQRLGMNRNIFDAKKLESKEFATLDDLAQFVIKSGGFAQVIPEHKFKVVEVLQTKGYLVGMTGDGVNDAPALKKANVGIAVHGCTDAARSAADIVLLAPGLGTIVDGIVISRQIFQRMRSYSGTVTN